MSSQINIQEVIQSIRDEALAKQNEKPHPDRMKLSNQKIYLTAPRPALIKRLHQAVKVHKFRIVYKIPVVGYVLRFASNFARLPVRIEQLYHGIESLNNRMIRLENLVGEQRKKTRQHKSEFEIELTSLRASFEDLKVEAKSTLKSAQEIAGDFRQMTDRVNRSLESHAADSVAAAVQYEDAHFLDKFYLDFENRFRGSEEEIRRRLSAYLPYFQNSEIDFNSLPVLDVGCGRGEWLKLLRDHGIGCHGIDLNRIMVEECRKTGIDAKEIDVFAHLKSLPSHSLGAVTGFHIVEHLPFPALMRMLDEVHRVLAPGGLAIFETPNPENIVVGACNFYTDPTHLNPIPPHTLNFLMENRGFVNNLVVRSSPVDRQFSNDALNEVAHLFHGEQDYAVIGYKRKI